MSSIALLPPECWWITPSMRPSTLAIPRSEDEIAMYMS